MVDDSWWLIIIYFFYYKYKMCIIKLVKVIYGYYLIFSLEGVCGNDGYEFLIFFIIYFV